MIFDLLYSLFAIVVNFFGFIYNLIILIVIPKEKRSKVVKFKKLKVLR